MWYTTMETNLFFLQYQAQIEAALASINQQMYGEAYEAIKQVGASKATMFVCGNGGSASIAEHFTCDHSKGVRSASQSLRPNVVSLSSNMAVITAIGNDLGFDQIFSKQLLFANATSADILVIISSSGNSKNIIKAMEHAALTNMKTIALVGFDGGRAAKLATHPVHVSSNNYGIVEDCHQIIMHSWAQALVANG